MAAQVNKKSRRPATDKPKKVLESGNTTITGEEPLEYLELSSQAVTALRDAGLKSVQDVLNRLIQGDHEIQKIHGIGPTYTADIRQQLIAKGLLEPGIKPLKLANENKSRNQMDKEITKTQKAQEAKQSTFETEPSSIAIPPENRQYDASFTLKLLLNEDHSVRAMRVVDNRSKVFERWAEWDENRLIEFITKSAAVSLPEATPTFDSEEFKEIETIEVVEAEPEPTEAPTPKLATRLGISTVKVLRQGALGGMDLMLNPDEDFMVEAQFKLEGAEALSLTTQQSGFQVKVYAHDVTSGAATMLTTYTDNLVEDVLKYKTQMRVSGIAPGLYRLFILVILQAPIRMISHYDGPTFQVIGALPVVSPTAQREATLT